MLDFQNMGYQAILNPIKAKLFYTLSIKELNYVI